MRPASPLTAPLFHSILAGSWPQFTVPAALLRLAGSVLIEQHDEWEAGDRRYFSENSMLELAAMNTTAQTIEQVNLIPELIAA